MIEAQKMPAELGEYIERDIALLQRLGWMEFIHQCSGRGNLAHLHNVHPPARRLLKLYKHRGAPSSSTQSLGHGNASIKQSSEAPTNPVKSVWIS